MNNGFKTAEKLMGQNFIGPDDLHDCLGLEFSREQLEKIKLPFRYGFIEGILNAKSPLNPGKSVAQDHILLLSDKLIAEERKPFSIKSFDGHYFPGERQPKIYHYPGKDRQWYEDYDFSSQTCRFAWYLSPLLIPDSFAEKDYERQLRILPECYFVLLAIEEIFKNFLYFLKTGIRLNSDVSARCSDSPMAGYNVNAGMFSFNNELGINCCLGSFSSPIISISLAHKMACSS